MMNGMHDFSGNNLNPEQATLATVLQARGYDTGAVIAAAVLDRRFGLNHGFDFYYDHFDFSRLAESNLDLMERPANQVIDQALSWLASHRKKPFFLWVHLYDPHHPYKPPAPFNEQYRANLYDGEIAFTDTQLARLLGYLKQQQLYQKTLVVLSGDHGEGLGEHGEKTHGFFIYNATLHVPLIFHLPQRSVPSVRDAQRTGETPRETVRSDSAARCAPSDRPRARGEAAERSLPSEERPYRLTD